jgi:hypothetical protein
MANRQKEAWELVKAAKRQGWRVKETKKGYFLSIPAEGTGFGAHDP